MTTTTNLAITHVEQNQTNKEVTINTALTKLDEAITDTVDVDLTSGNVTVTSANYRENICLKLTNATVVGRTVTLPAVKRLIAVVSDSANTQSVAIVKGSTSISLAAGATAIFYTDGTTNGLVQVGGIGGTATYIRSDATANLTAGYTATSFSAGTKTSGTFTPDPANGNIQHATNGGAHTLAPPSTGSGDSTSIVLDYTNNGSAGAITTSGFTKVTGDAFTTTNGHKFRCYISVGNAGSHLNVQAMQ